VIEPAALRRIGSYVGQSSFWTTLDEAADASWALSQGFGPHSREQWLALTAPQIKPATQDGRSGFTARCDPAIAVPLRAVTPELAKAGEALLWHSYERLQCATLLLRGADSDLLSPATALAMTQRGPRAQLHEFAGVGHAPTLVQPDQIEVLRRFLLSP
jgi:pimeloyl-ACP methyl ester carboxylesterase